MLLPIRPLQSTEVRRVDEVTPRKYVTPRVQSPFAEASDDVRLTIGDDARRLAYGQGGSAQQSAAEPPSSAAAGAPQASPFVGPQADAGDEVLRGATLPLAFQDQDEDEFGFTSDEPNALANRALRAFTSSGVSQPQRDTLARESAFPEDEGEAARAAEDTSRVPFEVLQRAVTDATAGSASSRGPAFSPLQPIFSAPENGGTPYGRAVPFEDDDASGGPFGAVSSQPQSGVMPKLTREAVDELIEDLNWSLPEQRSLRPETAAA